jgi:hypothetical protein
MVEKGKNYLAERAKWVTGGKVKRSPERINEIFEICKSNKCGLFKETGEGVGQCGSCGCRLANHQGNIISQNFNKIEWATTACPEKYWGSEEEWEVKEVY